MRKAEIVTAILFFAFSGFSLYLTFGLRPPFGVDVGGAFYPRILIAITAVLALSLFYGALKKPRLKEEDKKAIFDMEEGGFTRVLFVVICTFIYQRFLEQIGFLIFTPFYLFGLLFSLKAGKARFIIPLSLIVTFLIWAIFQLFLRVPLPAGLLY